MSSNDKTVAIEEVTRRQQIADVILKKMSFGTFKTRQNLLKWLKEARRVTGFSLDELKRLRLVTDQMIQGKLGAEAKALRKANAPIFDELIQFPVSELTRYANMMSSANIQNRYGRRISDKEIGVPIVIGKPDDDIVRAIDIGTKPQINGWLRSKQNKAVRTAQEPVRQAIHAKENKTMKRFKTSVKSYAATLKNFGSYIDDGLRRSSLALQEVEARTKTKQNVHKD